MGFLMLPLELSLILLPSKCVLCSKVLSVMTWEGGLMFSRSTVGDGIVVSYCTAPIPLPTSKVLFTFGPLSRRRSCHQVEGLGLSVVPMTS